MFAVGDPRSAGALVRVPDWPLVGRADTLHALRELLTGPDPRTVVLAGAPGVGKTRLGHECLLMAAQAGFATAHVVATRSAARLPFAAVAPLLHAAAPAPGAVDDRSDLLRRSVAALADRPDGSRLLVFVDDAHLLDDASATLVHQVAATAAVTVLATVQTGEPAPDPVVSLWKDGLAERIELGGLDRHAVEELLARALGGPVDPATAVQFADRCQGNALFLRELVIGAVDDGSLHDDGGIWRLERELSPSPRLVEIVEACLGRLDEHERALLELVAYGEPLGQAELSSLADPAVAEALERRDLLAGHVEGRRLLVHLAHPIYGDVVRARTPALRARAVAESLAEAVEATRSRRHEDVLRVATWRLLAGSGDPDVLLEGAAVARWRYDFALAERLARAAIDAGAGFAARLLAAHLAGIQGRREQAEAELEALADEAADGDQRTQVALARFDTTAVWSGHAARALDAAGASATAPRWRDRLAARRLAVVLDTHGPRAGAEAAQDLARRADGDALAFACLVGAHGLTRQGRIGEALALTERGPAARQHVDSPLTWYPWWHTVTRCLALHHAGRLDEAERIVDAHHGQALAEGSAEAQAVFALLGASATGERGRVRRAARRAREALAVNQRLGRPVLVRRAHLAAALAAALAGDAAAGDAHLAALDALDLPAGHDEADLLRVRAWVAAAAGDLPRAGDHLVTAAARAAEIGDHVGEAAALHDLARLGRAPEVRDPLVAVAGHIEGELAPARVAHVEALVAGDAGALERVSATFEALGADLLAAEAAADAAVARRREGKAREAAAAERRAGLLAERCEDPVTPALQAIEARARLTAAERETAVLAAAGRANREIAELLHLSPRTVENRLQRVYEKMGVSGRTELAGALGIEGPAAQP